MRIHHKAAIGLTLVAAVLVAVRLALPGWGRDFANERLSQMGEDYSGHLEQVDIVAASCQSKRAFRAG